MNLDPQAMQLLAATAGDIQANRAKYQQAVPSPCVSVCQMDADTGLCLGCLRTLDEIGQWGGADHARKRDIWQAIEARCAQYSEVNPT